VDGGNVCVYKIIFHLMYGMGWARVGVRCVENDIQFDVLNWLYVKCLNLEFVL